MTKPSLITRIENFARNNPFWIPGGEYEKLAIQAGYKGSHADRRCRDLVKEGKLDKEMRNGHIWYRYVPEEDQKRRKEITFTPSPEVARVGQQSFI